MIPDFSFARTPAIVFGPGTLGRIHEVVAPFGKHALIVTGSGSFSISDHWERMVAPLKRNDVKTSHVSVTGEPSPDWVDDVVSQHRGLGIDCVVAIGGGSAMDAGKAVSAMLPCEGSVKDYLEGVGTGEPHSGDKTPFVAAPTTAGTGSEATKNAVLSRVGEGGFKKSLRHDCFVPDVAIVDPELALSCPRKITAVCGMDAFTQLLESYLSTKGSPMTDALAYSGLEALCPNLPSACNEGAGDIDVRSKMAYAALISGITLANAGLGTIHGLASGLGARVHIPHGVVCGTLMGSLNRATIIKLCDRFGWNHPALKKYAQTGALMQGKEAGSIEAGCNMFLDGIEVWLERFEIPRLGEYGIKKSDIQSIAAEAGNKNNPVALEPHEIEAALMTRL